MAIVGEPTRVRDGLDVSLAGKDKAIGADRFDDAPIFSNNQSRPLNKPRTSLFSKREFGAAWYQKKFAYSVWRAFSTGSPPSKLQPPRQFPISTRVPYTEILAQSFLDFTHFMIVGHDFF
jgi:hypothetical protein